MLLANVNARNVAPWVLILLPETLSTVSVYVEKYGWKYETNQERTRITMLFRSASARCCAPIGPI